MSIRLVLKLATAEVASASGTTLGFDISLQPVVTKTPHVTTLRKGVTRFERRKLFRKESLRQSCRSGATNNTRSPRIIPASIGNGGASMGTAHKPVQCAAAFLLHRPSKAGKLRRNTSGLKSYVRGTFVAILVKGHSCHFIPYYTHKERITHKQAIIWCM